MNQGPPPFQGFLRLSIRRGRANMHFLIGLGLLIAIAMALNSEKGRKVLGTMFLIVLGVVGVIALLIMWAVQQGKSPPTGSAEQPSPSAVSPATPSSPAPQSQPPAPPQPVGEALTKEQMDALYDAEVRASSTPAAP